MKEIIIEFNPFKDVMGRLYRVSAYHHQEESEDKREGYFDFIGMGGWMFYFGVDDNIPTKEAIIKAKDEMVRKLEEYMTLAEKYVPIEAEEF